MELVVVNINDLVKLEGDRAITREEFDTRARASVLVGCCRFKPIETGVESAWRLVSALGS